MNTPDTSKPVSSAPSKRNYSRKSTATEAQYQRVDQAFDYPGKRVSTIEFRAMGVMHPSGRIKEMNERRGYDIRCVERRNMYDDEGFLYQRIAVYELLRRPDTSEVLQ